MTGSACRDLASGGINHVDSTPRASVPTGTANQVGSSFPPLPDSTTYEEQLSKMEGRGLTIADMEFAIARLRDLNYYRLCGYWLTLEQEDSFATGASFDDIWEIYQLDRELRMWLWRATAPIEIKLRTQFAYHFAHLCDAGAYLDAANYGSRSKFERAMSNFERERDRARDQGVPCVSTTWTSMESFRFGRRWRSCHSARSLCSMETSTPALVPARTPRGFRWQSQRPSARSHTT